MSIRHIKFWIISALLLSVSSVAAQNAACSTIIEDALNTVDQHCDSIGRNQACYGNIDLQATPRTDTNNFEFSQVGDIADVNALQSLDVSPFNADDGTWGVAVMKLQADLPDTLPGKNVTFLLYGDTRIENAASDDQPPMQAFYLQTGISQQQCADAPEDGLLVQTPDGVEQVTFNVNGVDVAIGSTVFFQAQSGDTMKVSTVEGSAIVNVGGELFPAIAGSWTEIRLDDDLRPIGFPTLPDTYAPDKFEALPVRLLERAIDVSSPLDDEQLRDLQQKLQQGDAPCGGRLIACDALPNFDERDWDVRSNHWDRPFRAGRTCAVTLNEASSTRPVCPRQHLQLQCDTDNADRPFYCSLDAVREYFEGDADSTRISPAQLRERSINRPFNNNRDESSVSDNDPIIDADEADDTLPDADDLLDPEEDDSGDSDLDFGLGVSLNSAKTILNLGLSLDSD